MDTTQFIIVIAYKRGVKIHKTAKKYVAFFMEVSNKILTRQQKTLYVLKDRPIYEEMPVGIE
jgi:hypothetical protein